MPMCTLAAAVGQYVQAIKLHGVGSGPAREVRREHEKLRQFREYADALDAVRTKLEESDVDTVEYATQPPGSGFLRALKRGSLFSTRRREPERISDPYAKWEC